MGNIKIAIETLGEQPLTRLFSAGELRDKSIKDVLETMIKEKWEGKNVSVSNSLISEMDASGGYGICLKIGGGNMPVRYEPVSLVDPIRKYEVINDGEEPEVNLALSGHHVVGY